MGSDEAILMVIGGGLMIYADKDKKSQAFANTNYFEHPENKGNLTKNENKLYFAGGKD